MIPPKKIYNPWIGSWIQNLGGNSPRYRLSQELKHIRRSDDHKQAAHFRNWLLWIGCYPVKKTPNT
jgi:hypothetical protein